MKVHLLHKDRDFDAAREPTKHDQELVQDLNLKTLFAAMSQDDKWLSEVVGKVVLAPLTDISAIEYRQGILKDNIENESAVREIYDLAIEAIDAEKKEFMWGMRYPDSILSRSLKVLDMLVGMLLRLRRLADQHLPAFRSEGFRTLLQMIGRELDDEYLKLVEHHLKRLNRDHGVLISGHLGEGNKGTSYVLRRESEPQGDWLTRLFEPKPFALSYRLPDRDESGARALSELKDRGINLIANALAQSVDHILSFFSMLKFELAFYLGCVNLHRQLLDYGAPVCMPKVAAPEDRRQSAHGLYDVCLALNLKGRAVGNALAADGRDLVIITGANQGGKSTLLRGLGLAQLMMQNGMFVAAEAFHASICERMFTHFKREEDAELKSGKFDEELSRMSGIIDDMRPHSLVLFNESFAATNEREGSEIARQIVAALTERRVKAVFVTHQYEFAHGFLGSSRPAVLFLRAERQEDGTRTFKITEGEPLRTSYGQDLYHRVFGDRINSHRQGITEQRSQLDPVTH